MLKSTLPRSQARRSPPSHPAIQSPGLARAAAAMHAHAPPRGAPPQRTPPAALPTRQGHVAAVQELLRDPGRRGLLRAMSRDGSTALHLAAAAGQEEVAGLLLVAGAPADVKDRVRGRGRSAPAAHILLRPWCAWLAPGAPEPREPRVQPPVSLPQALKGRPFAPSGR